MTQHDRNADHYLQMVKDLRDVQRLEQAHRIAEHFEAMNADDGDSSPVALIVVCAVTLVVAFCVGWAVTSWWTALNAATISAGL